MRDFPLKFRDGPYHSKLEAESLKIDSYDTSFLPFFWRSFTSDFLRSIFRDATLGARDFSCAVSGFGQVL